MVQYFNFITFILLDLLFIVTIGNYLVFQIYCYDVITVNHLVVYKVWVATNNVCFEN